jgi:tRNA(His) guanylyltransferase
MNKPLSLFERQREYYEDVTRTKLPRRTHTLLRADGVSFSKFTKGLDKPFSNQFISDMNAAAVALCEKAQNAKFAFVQSDEISVVLSDYDTLNTTAWFGNELRKLCSVSAGIVTAAFAQQMAARNSSKEFPFFDCRAWTIPSQDEVLNYFLSRQSDCTRNSLSSVAQVLYSHNELEGKGFKDLNEMVYQKREELRDIMKGNFTLPVELHDKEDLNWNDIPAGMKRGRLIYKENYAVPTLPGEEDLIRSRWVVTEAPIFSTAEAREFLMSFFNQSSEK